MNALFLTLPLLLLLLRAGTDASNEMQARDARKFNKYDDKKK